MTFIRLGQEDSTGSSFYAKQTENFGDFDMEFEFVENKQLELSDFERKSKGDIKRRTFLLEYGVPVVLMAVSAIIIRPLADKAGGVVATLVGGFGFGFIMLLSRMAKSFYGPQERKKEVEKATKETKKLFSNCPNPLCNHVLTDNEIEIMRCKICNIQHS